MENSQFSIQVKCFKLVGLYRNQLGNHSKLRHFLHIFIATPVFLGVLSVIFFVAQNYRDILVSAEAFGIIFTGIITLSKLATFCLSKEKFFQLMDDIKKLSERGNFVFECFQQFDVLNLIV
jgi:hypothetical protein